ncbi:neuroblastoma breakpoint family member 1-like isoform X1 [Aotus nancymaae]|uniref:neuroblastoma breakpoint family member 1-like isoform X1 n=2 Tax=Aotus nancymaae TaxID=37293 RepID=UPI0030FED461
MRIIHKGQAIVPGSTCGAPNVSMVPSSRTCSGNTTEANFTDTLENSYSHQEETKPNIRDSKNRLLMTQVAYFLNYQLKTYRDRKDNDEEQKCRDRKNKLLMSQVGYYLGCRLKTEVPGFLCSATNISKVASGRPPSRKNTEVNVPEGFEKSCSRQEENKPNFRDSKNRLLMTQVAYFLNYQLKTYRDRKDNDEEQKCRDRKNKLLMSQVGYYLGCRLKTEVPGFLCSATNISKVASGRPPSRKNTEVNVPEGIEKSCSRQEENKPNFRDSKNRLLMTQVAYFLNYQLKTYKDRKDNDEEQKCRDRKNKLLMSQVGYYLGCRLKTEVPGFLCSAPNVSKVASGRPPSRTNTEVNVPEGIDISCSLQEDSKLNIGVSKNRLLMSHVDYSLNYQLKTCKDQKDHEEEQKYGDSKNKLLMSQAAYYPGCQLKTEEGRKCHEEEQKYGDSKNKLIKCEVACYMGCRLKTENDRKCHEEEQKYGDSKNKLIKCEVACYMGCRLKTENDRKCHEEEQKYGDSKNKLIKCEVACYMGCRLKTEKDQKDNDEEKKCRDSKNRLLRSHVDYSLNYQLKTCKNDKDEDEDVHVAEAEKIEESRVPREVQKVEVKKVPEDSLEECVITRSNSCGPTDSSQPHGDTNEIPFEEDNVDSALVVENESSHDVVEDALIILSESLSDDEEEEEKGPVPPRNLQESVEEEAPQESWDEGYLTLSIPPGTSAFSESYRSNLHSLEEQQVDLAVDIGKIKKDQEEEEDQGPLCPRLSTELVEAEEPEVWYSPDILYSTYTAYPEFYYICQDYTYVIFLFVEEYVRLTLDMDNRFLTMTVTRLHLVSRIGVTFPH